MVSLAWSHRDGKAHQGCLVGRRCWPEVENYSSWFPACQQHLRFPFPWDHQVRPGSVGTMVLQEEDLHLQLPPPPQIPRRWWLALHPTRDLRQPHQPLQVLPDYSHAGEFVRQEPAVAVMTDDWEQRITQLGLTKTTHEYAMYQLFSTALGWSAWRAFLPDKFANHKLLITRAIRLLTAATIRPAHARPPHPRGSLPFVRSSGAITHRANCCFCEPVFHSM